MRGAIVGCRTWSSVPTGPSAHTQSPGSLDELLEESPLTAGPAVGGGALPSERAVLSGDPRWTADPRPAPRRRLHAPPPRTEICVREHEWFRSGRNNIVFFNGVMFLSESRSKDRTERTAFHFSLPRDLGQGRPWRDSLRKHEPGRACGGLRRHGQGWRSGGAAAVGCGSPRAR